MSDQGQSGKQAAQNLYSLNVSGYTARCFLPKDGKTDRIVYMHAAMHENPADQSYSKDPSTTREKEDADNITVPFAYIGKSLYVIYKGIINNINR